MYTPGGGQCGCCIAEEEIMAVAIYLSTCIYQEVDNVAAALLKGEIMAVAIYLHVYTRRWTMWLLHC